MSLTTPPHATTPYVVVWRVTENCNLGCPFCLYDKKLTTPRQSASPEKILNFIGLLKDLSAHTNRKILISWLGGEPFIWPHIRDVTKNAHENGLLVSTTTNGTSLGSPSLRQHILDYYHELTISIDAIGETHEKLRQWSGGYTKLSKYITALSEEKAARQAPLQLKANIVLMRDTLADFPALCAELADWGIETITFNQLGGTDRPEYFSPNRLLPDDVDALENLLPALQNQLAARGVTLLGSPAYMNRIRASAHDEKLPVENCGPGQNFLFVDEAGWAAPCSFTSRSYGVNIDTIKSVADLENLRHIFDQRQAENRAAPCDDCQSTQHFEKFTPSQGAVFA